MVICLDPASLDLLQDFCSDRSVTTLLEIDCEFDDDYLKGHARRVGLAGARTGEDALQRLLPTVRNAIAMEHDQIRDAEFPNLYRIRQSATVEQNARAMGRFLAVSDDVAHELANTPHLFAD